MIEILVICGSFRDRDAFRQRILSQAKSISPSRFVLKNEVGITLGIPSEDFRGNRYDLIMFDDTAVFSTETYKEFARLMKP